MSSIFAEGIQEVQCVWLSIGLLDLAGYKAEMGSHRRMIFHFEFGGFGHDEGYAMSTELSFKEAFREEKKTMAEAVNNKSVILLAG